MVVSFLSKNLPFPNRYPSFVAAMQNDKGEIVDLYIPRKCSITNRIISAKDHASVQINIGELDNNGVLTGKNFTFASCGFVREMGEADDSFNKLCLDAKILNF